MTSSYRKPQKALQINAKLGLLIVDMDDCIYNPTIRGCLKRSSNLDCFQSLNTNIYDSHQKQYAWNPKQGCKLQQCSQYKIISNCKLTLTVDHFYIKLVLLFKSNNAQLQFFNNLVNRIIQINHVNLLNVMIILLVLLIVNIQNGEEIMNVNQKQIEMEVLSLVVKYTRRLQINYNNYSYFFLQIQQSEKKKFKLLTADNQCELETFTKSNEQCQYYYKNSILQQEGSNCISFTKCSKLNQNTCGKAQTSLNQKCAYYSKNCRSKNVCSDIENYQNVRNFQQIIIILQAIVQKFRL
ncbi:unnamed protein product [Paramecium sonneborni]|uniref:Transmembrane protein n=1 Tax=Paramecium sonneborni TaxID=65129 RepID=A0A8S1RHQ9_9CILI|nr:unnamed protein product [Paramecium sonneborni]